MTVSFGVRTFVCPCVPIGVGVLAISRSVLPTCGGLLMSLLGVVGDLVAVRRSLVTERGPVVTSFRRSVAFVGLVVPQVGGLVALDPG